MEARSSSPWPARVLLLTVYLGWVGLIFFLGAQDSRWAAIAATLLVVLIWLPCEVYRNRRQWLVCLPLYLTVTLGAVLAVIYFWYDADINSRRDHTDLLFRPVTALLSAVFGLVEFLANRVIEKREAEKIRAFVAERTAAPRHKPVMHFAGKPVSRET